MEESASPAGCLLSIEITDTPYNGSYDYPSAQRQYFDFPPGISGEIGLQELIHLCRGPAKKKHR